MQFAAPFVAASSVVLFVRSWRASIERKKRTDAILTEYRELFDTPVERLLELRDALVEQMEAGLTGKEGGLMMLPSYVDVLPSGRERGDCYAIDLGGTNLRVAHVALSETDGAVEETHIRNWEVPEEHFDLDSGGLIAFVAQCTAEVVREHAGSGGGGKPVIGFCFSFPVEQTALDNGRVLSMTKNFKGTGLLGRDVVAELRRELAAQGIDAEVPAVMNDTVATLVALRYSEPDTQLGIIVGTGTNCAYAERVSDIRKLPPGFRGRTDRMVINSEWGDFDSPLLPSCEEDIWIDCSSTHPGRALFEKQISGLFLGELARRILLRLAEKERLFGGVSAPGLLARHNKFSCADMAACDEDDSPDLREVAAVLERVLEIRGTTRQQRATVQEVCRLVCTRSARLTAAAIASVLKRLGHPAGTGGSSAGSAPPPRVVIAFDGSVFSKYSKYRERLRVALEEVCGKTAADSIYLQLAQDGSLLGAAFLAVAAAEWEAARGGSSSADAAAALDLSSVPPKELGIVDNVLSIAETGQAQPLLHVRASADPRQAEDAPREEHLIPYVPQIVPTVDLRSGLVFIQPPAGLLDLGRQQLLLATLRQELAPYTTPPPLSLLARMGLRVMPNSRQLAAAGRQDLVVAIKRAGGFLEVAQALGLRSQRKPAGYWDDEMNLDEELTLFVAAHWTKFPDPESGQTYWYNQITHRISWEEPILPERVEIDDEGGYILTEAEEDRVMPSRSAVMAAGRYDLHHAILRFGGYTPASEILGRPSAWPPHKHLRSLAALRHELRAFLAETGLQRNKLPTASQLVNAGRGDLYKAIVRRGGFSATAQALGWETQRRERQAWADMADVARELRRFILAAPQAQHPEAQARRGRGQAAGRQQAAAVHDGSDEGPLPPGARMPTHRELASAGRHDLKYAVQQHGSANLAALLGIPLSSRGAHRRSEGGAGAAQLAAGEPG